MESKLELACGIRISGIFFLYRLIDRGVCVEGTDSLFFFLGVRLGGSAFLHVH
jgi:hypothetical protein